MLARDPQIRPHCGGLCYACLHKTLLPMVASRDIVSGTLLFGAGVLAGASGIGGGGLNVPLLMLSGNFLVEEAVPLSHAAVFSNSIAQNLVNARRAHPHAPARILIDLTVPVMLLPAQLIGNTIGVLVGRILPSTGVELLACVLLLYAAVKTAVTAAKQFRREVAAAAQATADASLASSAEAMAAENPPPPPPPPSVNNIASEPLINASSAAAALSSSAAAEDTDGPKAPASPRRCTGDVRRNLGLLMMVWLMFVADYLASKVWSGGRRCSPAYFAWRAALLLFAACAITGGAQLALRHPRLHVSSAQPGHHQRASVRLPGDILWTLRSALLLPVLAACVGLVAGLLGLGGGELMAPLLLALGMLPQVASATSACMVLFTSSSDIAQYVVEGVLLPDAGYAAAAAVIGFSSALIGRLLALRIVQRASHPSYIAFTLAALLVVALALLVVQMARADVDWSVGSLCD